MKRLEKLNTKDCLWIYILRVLKDKAVHAYLLRREINERFGFRPGTVTAYRVLYYLKNRGFVTKKAEGRKRVYKITDKGRKELDKAVKFYRNRVRFLS